MKEMPRMEVLEGHVNDKDSDDVKSASGGSGGSSSGVNDHASGQLVTVIKCTGGQSCEHWR